MACPDEVERPGGHRADLEREIRISALALRYRSGERAVLGDLYAELAPAIFGAIRPYVAGASRLPIGIELADLFQQAYVELAGAVHDWDPARSANFLPYFLRSFPWRIRHYVRSQTPGRQASSCRFLSAPHDLLMLWLGARPGHDGRDWDGALASEEMLRGLPSLQQQVVRLRVLGGFSFAEIGRRIGVGRSTAHETFQRAIMSLRSTLD